MRRETEILSLNAYKADEAGAADAAVRRRLGAFGRDAVLFYRDPIEMVEASGVWMTAADGRRYLDAYNNVPSVGHGHPRVVEAMARQAARLNTHTRYLSTVVDAYAERLLATMPNAISNLVLTCTGSEANDLALRIAEAATGRSGFVVSAMAYHGNTAAVTAVSPSSRPGRPLPPHVRAVPPPDLFRHPAATPGERLADAIDAAADDLEAQGIGFAGLIIDTIFSSDGIYADPPGLLKPVAERVRRRGGLLIADEVQPGFGRTGSAMWGFARHGIKPDLVTMGKPMGNGFPMGGVAARPEHLDAFTAREKYFNTFGGNPVAAATGLAVLDVIVEERLIDNARLVGEHLRRGLRDLMARHPEIGDVRGAGHYTGVEIVKPEGGKPDGALAGRIINGMKERGVLIGAAGPYGQVLKIRPPLPFSCGNAETLLDALGDALKRGASHKRRKKA